MSTQPSSIVLISVLAFSASLMLAGCAGQDPGNVQQPPDRTVSAEVNHLPASRHRTPGEVAAVIAAAQVGVPYRYGGSDIRGFDCSGLVQYAYAGAGKRLPRTTGEQWKELRPVPAHDLEVGDILFFNIEGKVSHVGLYLGSRRFVHAPSSGREVTVADLNSNFYRAAFLRGGRPR